MSKLKIVDDLFLEKQELKRMNKFLIEEGFEADFLNNAERFGFIRNKFQDSSNSWLAVVPSNILGIANLLPGYAIDKDHKKLSVSADLKITIPQDNSWYWVKLSHKYSSIEEGKFSIGGANGGLMTGNGTKFTEILRGQPNFPSKIRFVNSSNYIQEYEVLEVIDDQNCLLQGVFENIEHDLQYSVIGTFTPGYYPQVEDKEIFQYDSINLAVVQETEAGQIPSYVQDKEFYTCRIRNNAGNLEIQDYRYFFTYKTRTERLLNKIGRNINTLIAIEYVKKFDFNSNKFYIVGIDWKFNIENQNLNTTLRTATITAGKGGKFKTVDDFQEGNFNGWRYYYQNGEYSNILNSIKNSDSTITLVLEDIKFTAGLGISICPDANEIGIVMNMELGENRPYNRKFVEFPINKVNPAIQFNENELSVSNQFCDLKFFYKSNQETSEIFEFNENDYFTEKAFNKEGDLIDSAQKITNQDLYFNGGVSSGVIDGWNQFFPNEYALMYGNNLRTIDPVSVASKFFYKFFGSNTVHIQGRVNLTVANEPSVNGGLAPNGLLFKTPFTWFDDTSGNRYIRSFPGNLRYRKTPTETAFELVRNELFYTPSLTDIGEDTPSNKIAVRYLKDGVGQLPDPDSGTGNVIYTNPFPIGSSLQIDVDMTVFFDSFNENYVNGPVGTDDVNPEVASGNSPLLSNYSIAATKVGGSFNCVLTRQNTEINFKVRVNFLIKYRIRVQGVQTVGFLTTSDGSYVINQQISSSVIFNISELNKTLNIPVSGNVVLLKEAKITGVTII